eukprot:8878242-Pyramimonas_sp.AAC.1
MRTALLGPSVELPMELRSDGGDACDEDDDNDDDDDDADDAADDVDVDDDGGDDGGDNDDDTDDDADDDDYGDDDANSLPWLCLEGSYSVGLKGPGSGARPG